MDEDVTETKAQQDRDGEAQQDSGLRENAETGGSPARGDDPATEAASPQRITEPEATIAGLTRQVEEQSQTLDRLRQKIDTLGLRFERRDDEWRSL